MLGTNDSKTANWKAGNNAFEADYRALIAEYAALPGKPRIFTALPPPALTSNFSIDGRVIANEILPTIRRLSAAANVPVIHVNGAFNPDPRIYFGPGNGTDIADGIHPNNAGAAAIAGAVAPDSDGAGGGWPDDSGDADSDPPPRAAAASRSGGCALGMGPGQRSDAIASLAPLLMLVLARLRRRLLA